MFCPCALAISFRPQNTNWRNFVRYGNPNLRLAKRSDLPPRASDDALSLGKPSRTLEAHSNRSRVARLLDPPATARTSAECAIELNWRCGRSSHHTHPYPNCQTTLLSSRCKYPTRQVIYGSPLCDCLLVTRTRRFF